MPKVIDRLTPATPAQVRTALAVAWRERFAAAASEPSLLVLLSQWALETGRGRSMHCYNLGNIKSNGKSGEWCFFRCNEIINGKLVWIEPDAPGCRFRAHATLAAGASDYLATVFVRFGTAWPAVLAGDPREFSRRLRAARYYTAPEASYTAGLVALFREFRIGWDIERLQSSLVDAGAYTGAVDGILGPMTMDAVKTIQRTR